MPFFSVLFTIPSSTPFFAGIGAYSSPFFDEMLPLLYLVMGILIPVLVVVLLISLVHRK